MNKYDFSRMSDIQLVSWFIMFLNGTDWNPEDGVLFECACKEVNEHRSDEVKRKVEYLKDAI